MSYQLPCILCGKTIECLGGHNTIYYQGESYALCTAGCEKQGAYDTHLVIEKIEQLSEDKRKLSRLPSEDKVMHEEKTIGGKKIHKYVCLQEKNESLLPIPKHEARIPNCLLVWKSLYMQGTTVFAANYNAPSLFVVPRPRYCYWSGDIGKVDIHTKFFSRGHPMSKSL